MNIQCWGVNHLTASIDERERLYIAQDKLWPWLEALRQIPAVTEVFLLSTCNRVEVCLVAEQAIDESAVLAWFAKLAKSTPESVKKTLFHFQGRAAFQHLVEVASGLDSLVLGEPQIFGQMKSAYATLHQEDYIGKELEQAFQSVFRIAKRVRRETEIGVNSVSVASVAVSLARQLFGELSKMRCLLIGAGEMIRLVSQHIHTQQPRSITIANRSINNARLLADAVQGQAVNLEELESAMAQADLVISCTGSSLPLIGTGLVQSVQKQRKYRPLLLIDLAVPRDIEQAIDELGDVYLYCVDDLQQIVQDNAESRARAAKQAQLMIDQEVNDVMAKRQIKRQMGDVVNYRQMAEQWREELLQKALKELEKDPSNSLAIMEQFSVQLTRKLTHYPTQALREAIEQQDQQQIQVIKRQLGIE